MRSKATISADQTIELAEMFRLMSDPTRLSILFVCLAEPVSVGGIAERLKVSQPLVSHHLRLLRAARVMRAERQGKQIFYSVADDHIACVLMDMAHHVTEPAAELEAEPPAGAAPRVEAVA